MFFTRFIALGSVPGTEKEEESKEKYLHGLSMTPMSLMNKDEIFDTSDPHTKNPFSSSDDLEE